MDLYGFPLVGLTQQELAARLECAARAGRVADKWTKLLAPLQPRAASPCEPTARPQAGPAAAWSCTSVPVKVKLAVRDGIPARLRPLLWMQLSGAAALRATAPDGYYAATVKAAGVGGLPLTQLEADLGLVFPTHPLLYSRKTLEAVRRVVMAYGWRNAEVGYNFYLGGLTVYMLVVLGVDREEDAFWLLTALLENILPPAYYEDCKGCTVEQGVFVALLAKKCPRLTGVMQQLDVDIGSLTASWFFSLFTKTLPAETTARVWDCLLCEGPKVLFRVALALFKMNEAALLTTFQGSQLPRVLQWRVSRTYNADALAKMAFKGIGSLPMLVIQKNRACLEAGIKAEIEHQRQRIQALVQEPPRLPKRRIVSEPALNMIAEESESSSDTYYLSE